MIALLPADPQALTVPGGDRFDQIHLTLAYLGDDVTGWPAERADQLVTAVGALASAMPGPLSARVVGHATFAPGDAEDQCAVHLVGDCPDLAPLQRQVVDVAATVLGAELPAQHAPWIPHATAGYGLDAAALDHTGPVTLDRLVVALGSVWHELPLGAAATETAPAVTEADPDGEPTEEELAAIAAAALVAVSRQRDRTHVAAGAALMAVLAALGDGFDVTSARLAYDPQVDPAEVRAVLAAEIARQARILGVDLDWQTAVRDAHTAAALAGAAAAAHALTQGDIPVDPDDSPLPDPFDPREWIEAQQGGMGGDLATLLARHTDEHPVTDEAVVALIAGGAGALYYLDQQVSQTYLEASASLYDTVGLTEMWWNCMAEGACSTCEDYQARSPWKLFELPDVPHGGCRCWVTPS
jgi:hypothetical protein